MTPAEAEQLRRENEDLRRRLRELEARSKPSTENVARLTREPVREAPPVPTSAGSAAVTPSVWKGFEDNLGADEARYQSFKARLIAELPTDARVLAIVTARPELRVEVERQVVTLDGQSGDGWIGRLIVDGWFDEVRTGYATFLELQRRGARLAKPSAYGWCDSMVRRGFLTKEAKEGYRAVAGMKINVVEK